MRTPAITEARNPLTRNIDAADARGVLRILRQSDGQMFTGYETYPGIMDSEILHAMGKVAWKLSRLIQRKDAVVFLSGAGTSGRLAHLLAMEYNRVLKENRLEPCFRALIAGGNGALIRAQESAEDSPANAVDDLEGAMPGDVGAGMFLGITAGMSAPYVAAQLDHLQDNDKFHCVLLGYNPPSMAREAPIEGWAKTVRSVVDEAIESDQFTLLNPIYGPEPVCGATRTKGGTMTRMVTDVLFATALDLATAEIDGKTTHSALQDGDYTLLYPRMRRYMRRFSSALLSAYSGLDSLAELVRAAGTALRSGGRIVYLGRGISGFLGILDASECPATFGAGFLDVRGYLKEGWPFLGIDPATMRAFGREYEIDHQYFEQHVLPEISKGDLVIAVATGAFGENTKRLIAEANKQKATTGALLVRSDLKRETNMPDNVRHSCVVDVPYAGFIPGSNNEMELALKIGLNGITTGAHVLAGKVYTNVMIDVQISNSKLYERSIRLVKELTGATEKEAFTALYHAIFGAPPSDEDMENCTVNACVERASSRSRVVPIAILLATKRFSYEDAKDRLSSEPRVRYIIEEAVTQE